MHMKRIGFRLSGLRRPAVTVVAVASTLLLAVPASASTPVNLAAGIDRAAHTVTTHGGRVISGITFVDDRDLPALRQRLATQRATALDEQTFFCRSSWAFIKAGGTNTYWKTNPATKLIFANGNRSADYWNQEYLPCFDVNWDINAWALLSNATGQFVDWLPGRVTADMSDGAEQFYTMFRACTYDGNWIYMTYTVFFDGGGKDVSPIYRVPSDASLYAADPPLNGNNLFKVDAPLVTATCTF